MTDWLTNKILPALVMMLILGVANAYIDIKTLKVKAVKADSLSESVVHIKKMMCLLTLEITQDKKLKEKICVGVI